MKFSSRKLDLKDTSAVKFIKSYWMDSYQRSRIGSMIPYSVFYEHHPKLISRAIAVCDTRLLFDPSEPDHLIGFINGWKSNGKHYLNYVYIKQPFRGYNFAKDLAKEIYGEVALESPILTITHQGNVGGIAKNYQTVLFDPYLFHKL